MTLPVLAPSQKVVATGNSLTAGTPLQYYTTALATINAAFAPQALDLTNTGIGSTGIDALESAFNTRVLQYSPSMVWIEIGINDITVLGTTLADYLAKMTSIAHQWAAAGKSANNVIWFEIGLYGEAWHTVSGSPQFNNAFDSTIATWNAAAQALAETLGFTWVPVRAAFLAAAVIHNPTGLLTNGVLTLSTGGPNPHPNPALGQPIMAAQLLTGFTLSSTTQVSTGPISRINYDGAKIWIVGDAIARGTADGLTELAGCGWRNLLSIAFAASGLTPSFVGTLTDGYNCTSCPENGAKPAHDCPSGDPDAPTLQAALAGWFATIGPFDVMILESGTKDIQNDKVNHTNLAPGRFDSLLAAAVALRPTARFFVSNLPPSPDILTLGTAFAAHVASAVATYVAGGTKMVMIDHFNGIPPQGSALTLDQAFGNAGQDFASGGVHVAGPGGAASTVFQGFPKMAAITYLTMTHAAP